MVDDENLDLDSPEAEYSNKSDFSKAEIVKLQVQKCCEIRSKEMREGYFNYNPMGNKVYIPDARKEWISAVTALRNLLRPELLRDKRYKGKEKEIREGIKKAVEKFGIELNPESKKAIKIIPYLDQPFPVTKGISPGAFQPTKISTQAIPGLYNENFHNYWDEMVEIYDELYAELNILIDACNYFKQKTSY